MTKMAKIDILFMTKATEKPYALGQHIRLWPHPHSGDSDFAKRRG